MVLGEFLDNDVQVGMGARGQEFLRFALWIGLPAAVVPLSRGRVEQHRGKGECRGELADAPRAVQDPAMVETVGTERITQDAQGSSVAEDAGEWDRARLIDRRHLRACDGDFFGGFGFLRHGRRV